MVMSCTHYLTTFLYNRFVILVNPKTRRNSGPVCGDAGDGTAADAALPGPGLKARQVPICGAHPVGALNWGLTNPMAVDWLHASIGCAQPGWMVRLARPLFVSLAGVTTDIAP